MSLSIEVRRVDQAVVLELCGRLSVLEQQLRELGWELMGRGERYFVINLANVSYLDNSGLGQLCWIYTVSRNRGGGMNEVLVERRSDVVWLTFNRPEARNAMTFAMYERMAEVAHEVDSDRAVRALVLTGSGGAFVSGTDISQFSTFAREADALQYEERMDAWMTALERVRVRVSQGSTIQVKKNTYSVPARLIGERVEARIGAEEIEVRLAFPDLQVRRHISMKFNSL